MKRLSLLLFLCFAFVGCVAVASRSDGLPTVTVKNGTYTGVYSASYHQEFFLGMPYAQVPKRFTAAQGLQKAWAGRHDAKSYPPHCIGYGGDDVGYTLSEDCLYLNVIRPAGLRNTSNLPVAVWIHGGGLYMGGSADRRYNLSFMVDHSMKMGSPIIGVSLNYRLSAFGFLAGREATKGGATNLGFRDQRLALQWVRENIQAFGGSPAKVTVFGESSGAESIAAQVLAYKGRDDGLFRGAIAQSGFGGLLRRYPGGFNDTGLMQATYDRLVGNTSCARLVGTAQSLDCLRDVPFAEINHALNVSKVGPWPPILDGDFFMDFPANQLAEGDFRRVPVLIGTNSDEGTALGNPTAIAGHPVSSNTDLREALKKQLASSQTTKEIDGLVDELMYLYPDIQSVGIPSLETWPHVIQPNDSYAETLGTQYRRVTAIFGDLAMHYTRRRANLAWCKHGLPSFAYRFDVTVNGVSQNIGATHFQEVAFVLLNFGGEGYATNPFGGNDEAYTARAKALAITMATAWVNFINYLDPNGKNGLGFRHGARWPKYDTGAGGGVGQDVVWTLEGGAVEVDDWRAAGIEWMMDHALSVFGN
ncbi:prefoldin subunit 2 [Purpureocillium lavendulum]|uniref:Carboxylic ester hydrolase n=1 Tax=Purpureocillium lavendulum TaxID=1247861 RepID=A0AB34G452_9HYPO|nr:prefoldin subunit 2 [Purpureocillium lavendulum]